MADIAICKDCKRRLPGELDNGPACTCETAKEQLALIYTERFGAEAAVTMIANIFPSPS